MVTRIHSLEEMGHLTGVMDDRGKYIYITPDEMETVAKWIEKKGRVSVDDLVAYCNSFIDLTTKKDEVKAETKAKLEMAAQDVTLSTDAVDAAKTGGGQGRRGDGAAAGSTKGGLNSDIAGMHDDTVHGIDCSALNDSISSSFSSNVSSVSSLSSSSSAPSPASSSSSPAGKAAVAVDGINWAVETEQEEKR